MTVPIFIKVCGLAFLEYVPHAQSVIQKLVISD